MSQEKTNSESSSALPSVTFESLISEYAGTALAYLSGIQDPETKKVFIDLNLAKRMIDIIEMLKEKTEGNLAMPEKNFLDNTLYNLKMSYVRAVNNPPPQEDEASAAEDESVASTESEAADPETAEN